MDEFLAFVDEVGMTTKGEYIYRFDFTVDKDVVWGDFFNVTPTATIPKLTPDINTLSSTAKAIFPIRLALGRRSYCFSMQDCIDQILPLVFSEISDEELDYDGKPFFLMFGTPREKVENIFNELGIEIFDLEEVKKGDDGAIDNLMEELEDTYQNGNDNDKDFG